MKTRNFCLILTSAMLVAANWSCRNSSVTVATLNDTTTVVSITNPERYLALPVEEKAPGLAVKLMEKGKVTTLATIHLAQGKADYYVPFELPGKADSVRLLISHAPKDAAFLKDLKCIDQWKQEAESKDRPAIHYAPTEGWMGPVAGLVANNGEYHLFYEANPYGCREENLQWKQAVSKDLIHWEDCGVAISADTLGEALAGTCLVDKVNTLGTGASTLAALYTSSRIVNGMRQQAQSLAYSTDNGITFRKMPHNPVLSTYDDIPDFRNGGVVRYAKSNIWDVTLACGNYIRIYSSRDLANWNMESYFGEQIIPANQLYRSTQLVPLSEAGEGSTDKWLFLANTEAGSQPGSGMTGYVTGKFNGQEFTPDTKEGKLIPLDYGNDLSGALLCDNAEGRHILMGWMGNQRYSQHLPILPFRGTASLPREITISEKGGQTAVLINPAKEVETLRAETRKAESFSIVPEHKIAQLFDKETPAIELTFELQAPESGKTGVDIFNDKGEKVSITLDATAGKLLFDRHESGKISIAGIIPTAEAPLTKAVTHTLRILIDRQSIELFMDNGSVCMTNLIFPSEPYGGIRFYAEGSGAKVSNFTAYRLALDAEK